MKSGLGSTLEGIVTSASLSEIWVLLVRHFREHGFGAVGYVLFDKARRDDVIAFLEHGFPPAVVHRFAELGYGRHAPLLRVAMGSGQPHLGSQVAANKPLCRVSPLPGGTAFPFGDRRKGLPFMTVTIESAEALAAPLADLKACLRIAASDEDALLTDFIRAATDVAERFIGQLLIARGVEEMIAPCREWRALAIRPVAAITAVAGVPASGAEYALGVDA